MISTQPQLVRRPARFLVGLMRRRPKTCLAVALVVALAMWLGVDAWWHRHQRAALRDFQLDLLASAYDHQEAYLQQWPDDFEAHLLAARMARLLGSFTQAEKHLNKCMRLRGATEETQLEFLLMRAHGGELGKVEANLTRCVEEKDHYLLVLEGLTQSYMKELRYLSAAACLYKWLEEEPDSVRALSWRGWVRENLEFSEGALEDYRRVLQISPRHATTRLRLANMLLSASKVPEAAANLDFLERITPDNPEVLIALAQCRSLQGRDQEAIAYLDKLLAGQPDHVRALYQRGKLEIDPVKKEKWFREAIQGDPSFHDASYALYVALNQQPGRKAEAAQQLKSYEQTMKTWMGLKDAMQELERSPHNPELLAKVGNILLTRDPVTALSFLQKALAIAPEHQRANETLARYFDGRNEPEKAAIHRKRLSAK
ncbi:MAG: tetratricopeptide repeat protein [Planctomycetes bacterium]|nr:tetratricopeptide repeat protein [Planctomycetota bacterium]